MFFRLFHAALSYSTLIERKVLAGNVAERQLARLRGWAATPVEGGFQFDDWSSKTNISFADEEHPEYTVTLTSEAASLPSPCTGLPKTPPFEMAGSARRVQVDVAWRGELQTRLVSLIADPTRRFRATDPLEMSGSTGPLGRDETMTLSVRAFDQDGREIPDLVYRWYVQPESGNGTLLSSVGPTATFRNSYGLDQNLYTGGSCRVRVLAVYRGETAWATSASIPLN